MRIEINGVNFHVLQQGTGGPALVFLHYFGGSSRSWCPVMETLQRDFRCIAPDLRGFGASSAAPDDYSVSDAADDLSALITSLRLEHYALVGHSMGGKIALEMAARGPRGLQSLILLAPSPPTPEPMQDEERQRLLSTQGERAAAEETLRKITAHSLPSALYEQAVTDSLRSSRGAWQAWLECGSREDIAARMAQIRVPVVVVAGEHDEGMTTALLQREVVARISGASLSVILDAAHLLPLETPSAVAGIIEKWIDSGFLKARHS
jgi:pimeloyl-ACP methyl ester carboxylesterase